MKITTSSFEFIDKPEYKDVVTTIERIGRTCYKSESNITSDSGEAFIRQIIKRGHEAMIEHASFSVKFTVDRGVSHEFVRHRLASFAQESTRYCNYSKDKFGDEITIIDPTRYFKNLPSSPEAVDAAKVWYDAMVSAEIAYNQLIALGESAQMARSVLPNSLKTEIVITANFREWRTICKLRTPATAHPQMREVMCPLLETLKIEYPAFFEDILLTY